MSTKSSELPSLLKALQLSELEPNEQEKILLDIDELIFKGTMIRIMEQMNEKSREKFTVLLESDSPEEDIEKFIEIHAPNADSAVIETIKELTDDMLAVTNSVA
jgi:hypothetical protein